METINKETSKLNGWGPSIDGHIPVTVLRNRRLLSYFHHPQESLRITRKSLKMENDGHIN